MTNHGEQEIDDEKRRSPRVAGRTRPTQARRKRRKRSIGPAAPELRGRLVDVLIQLSTLDSCVTAKRRVKPSCVPTAP